LRGVSLGNFLIKRVAEELKKELPKLSTFCTLSPIPGFTNWLAARAADPEFQSVASSPARREALADAYALLVRQCDGDLSNLAGTEGPGSVDLSDLATQRALMRLCATYLVNAAGQGGDPVARFHLDNGARLERLNPRADLSRNGLRNSAGLMVNYLYDLTRIETNHEQFKHGVVVHSRAIAALL